MRAGARRQTADHWGTADESARRVASFQFFSSGSQSLDRLLGGGYRAGRLTEIFGRSNSGKSQLAMQAALIAARAGAKCLFIDTEGAFRPERLEEMARARGWEIPGVLQRVVYARIDSAPEQMETIRRMEERNATASCRFVLIDTLTRNFSVELPGKANLSSRQAALDVHLSEMARDAYLNARAYLLTNRVTFGTDHDVGIGGKTVSQLVHASVRLEKEAGMVKVTLMSNGESIKASVGAAGVD